ncbi:MAG: hypothetical protein JNM43_00820 [Planctomycetaceae bacterium]|nr:hypothetical protein [Planctomycetaceae bacterium]
MQVDVSMPSIHFPQPSFEDEISASGFETEQTRRPAIKLARLIEELEILSGLGALPGDVVLTSVVPPAGELPAVFDGIQFMNIEAASETINRQKRLWRFEPWGWSPSALKIATTLGLECETASLDSVRIVNSRQFSSQFDIAIDLETEERTTPFGTLCRTVPEVIESLERYSLQNDGRWVIKANISHAARNRVLGSGQLRESQLQWLESQLAQAPVYVEPWVERIAECGLQFDVGKRGASSFLGAAEMITDLQGQYHGSILRPCETEAANAPSTTVGHWWKPSIDHGQTIVEAASDLGFRGPLGIDCMVFREAGRLRLRLAHDINGRRTMGRLALSLRRHVPRGHWACWCFASAKSEQSISEALRESSTAGVQIMPTSPAQLCGRATTLRTCLAISADWKLLNQVAQKILSHDIRGPFDRDTSGTHEP